MLLLRVGLLSVWSLLNPYNLFTPTLLLLTAVSFGSEAASITQPGVLNAVVKDYEDDHFSAKVGQINPIGKFRSVGNSYQLQYDTMEIVTKFLNDKQKNITLSGNCPNFDEGDPSSCFMCINVNLKVYYKTIVFQDSILHDILVTFADIYTHFIEIFGDSIIYKLWVIVSTYKVNINYSPIKLCSVKLTGSFHQFQENTFYLINYCHHFFKSLNPFHSFYSQFLDPIFEMVLRELEYPLGISGSLLTNVFGGLALFYQWCRQLLVSVNWSTVAHPLFARTQHLLRSSAWYAVLQSVAQHVKCISSVAFTPCFISPTPPFTQPPTSLTNTWSADGTVLVQIILVLLSVLVSGLLVLCCFLLIKVLELLRVGSGVTHIHYHNYNDSIKTNDAHIKTNNIIDVLSPFMIKRDPSFCFPLFSDAEWMRTKYGADIGDLSQDITVMMATADETPVRKSDSVETQPDSTPELAPDDKDSVETQPDSTPELAPDDKESSDEPAHTKTEHRRLSSHHLTVPEFAQRLTSSRETTPDKKTIKRIRTVSWGGADTQPQDTDGDVSSSASVASSQQSTGNNKKDSWIREDGCFTLDRTKMCHLSFMNNYIEADGAMSLKKELISAIDKTCSFANCKRFKIEMGNSVLSKYSDIDTKKKGKRNPKVSAASVNLEEDTELAKLIVQYREKVSKSVNEIFNISVEFDKVVLQRFSGPEDSIPYESTFTDENSGFSPIVTVLSIGQPEAGARPMLMKTKTGSIVTHKIALSSGSLCTLSGRTECRYRRSIPKDYGAKGDHFFLFFVQRTPDSSILNELMKIQLQPKVIPEIIVPTTDQLQDVTDQATTDGLKTPPTVKRVVPEPLAFLDAMDFEVGGGLLLAESLSSAVSHMDDDTLNRELIRNHTSIAGTEEQKKARLQQRLSMSIGEITSSAANCSVSVNQLQSPTESVETFRQDLERVSNSQSCIENTLTKVIESIVNIREDMSGMRSDNFTLKDELLKPPSSKESSPGTLKLVQKVAECTERIKQLNENIAAVREDLASVQDTVTTLSTSTGDAVKDMQAWHNSVFSDEDSQRIKLVYDHILKYQDTADGDTIYLVEKGCQTGPFPPEARELIPESSSTIGLTPSSEDQTDGDQLLPPQQDGNRNTSRQTTFNWPDRMHLGLKTALLNNRAVRVCLISDSIMRHTTEPNLQFRQHNVHFERIDRGNTEALGQERLRNIIKKRKPHVLILHQGINDIQMGTPVCRIMENFADFEEFLKSECPGTKIIFSKPLLNGKRQHDKDVMDLRRSLDTLRNTRERSHGIVNQRLFVQNNKNFIVEVPEQDDSLPPCQKMRYFNQQDLLHLSQKGKDTMICNVRDSLHRIFREYMFQSYQ